MNAKHGMLGAVCLWLVLVVGVFTVGICNSKQSLSLLKPSDIPLKSATKIDNFLASEYSSFDIIMNEDNLDGKHIQLVAKDSAHPRLNYIYIDYHEYENILKASEFVNYQRPYKENINRLAYLNSELSSQIFHYKGYELRGLYCSSDTEDNDCLFWTGVIRYNSTILYFIIGDSMGDLDSVMDKLDGLLAE